MASTKFYLDSRNIKPGNPCQLKIVIYSGGKSTYIQAGVKLLPHQWDETSSRVVKHPNKVALNALLGQRMNEINQLIYDFTLTHPNPSVKELREMIEGHAAAATAPKEEPRNVFLPYMEKFMKRYHGRTLDLYKCTKKKVVAFMESEGHTNMTFEQMNKDWLFAFDSWLAVNAPSQNSRNIHFRNIRAIFNDAIDEEVITCYPFRKFKIKPVRTKKRSFKVEVLRKIFNAELDGFERKYRDMFMLIFCLCGINVIDLCHLKSIEDGRIEFERAKTGRHYSIKVEPEAMALIQKYKGKDWLLNPLDTNANYRSYYMRLCNGLKVVKENLNKEDDGLVIENLTSYWARHSWATIAAKLDIPKETIAAALGHGGNTVTDIYIDFDQEKVDDANRKVLDWVFQGKDYRKAI